MAKRRNVLIGVGGMIAIAGCGGEDPDFEEGDVGDDTEEDSEEVEVDDGESEQEETGEAVFEVIDTDDGATFLSSEQNQIGGVVENTGDATAEKEIGLYENEDEPIDVVEVELAPGETFEARVTWDEGAIEPDEYLLILSTEDDTETFTVTVEDDGPSAEDIELLEHDYVVDEGEYTTDVYVEGRVANNADTMADYVEVTVRVYDSSGAQLESYIDNTSDLAANTDWVFEVNIFEDPDDIDDYDVAVEDIRF